MSYLEQRQILIRYLQAKLEAQDWHGVRDCAVDIEILDARHAGELLKLAGLREASREG